MVTNASDRSVNNAINLDFVSTWREYNGVEIQDYQFPKELDLPHDLITPTRQGSRVDVVYPKLLELLGAANESSEPEG